MTISVLLDGVAARADKPPWHPQVVVANTLRQRVSSFPPASTVYLDNGPGSMVFNVPDDWLPGRAAMALLLFPALLVDGRQLYFVEHDAQLLARLRAEGDTPLAQFVVGPEQIPRGANYVRDHAAGTR